MSPSPWLRFAVLALGLAISGCSTSKQPYKPVREKPTVEEAQQLRRTEALWKAEDPKFPAARDKILKNPVTAAWWIRALVWYAVGSHNEHLSQQRDLLGTVKAREPVGYKKARAELRIAGGVAVPILVDELLRHSYRENRDLGVEILVYMGSQIVPELEPQLTHKDKRVRRQVLQVLGGMAGDARAQELLAQNVRDPDFSIRAQALESLARAGDARLPLLRQAAVQDPDKFVRRRVIAALAGFKDKQTAAIVVAYYKHVLRKGDRQGIRAARQTLRAMSGIHGEHNEAFWELWLAGLPATRNREGR